MTIASDIFLSGLMLGVLIGIWISLVGLWAYTHRRSSRVRRY